MRRIKWYLRTWYVGANYEGEFDIEDGTHEDEIEEMVEEQALSYIEWYWEYAKEDEKNA